MLSMASGVVKKAAVPYICTMPKRYWLIKSEPEVYPIERLKKEKRTLWTGVRNYQARNFMVKDMSVGDAVLFYHSNAERTGIVGMARVSAPAVADPEQFDQKSEYHDPKATPEKPIWLCVEVEFQRQFRSCLTLAQLRAEKPLQGMALLQRGQRLSVQPVSAQEFTHILKLAGEVPGT